MHKKHTIVPFFRFWRVSSRPGGQCHPFLMFFLTRGSLSFDNSFSETLTVQEAPPRRSSKLRRNWQTGSWHPLSGRARQFSRFIYKLLSYLPFLSHCHNNKRWPEWQCFGAPDERVQCLFGAGLGADMLTWCRDTVKLLHIGWLGYEPKIKGWTWPVFQYSVNLSLARALAEVKSEKHNKWRELLRRLWSYFFWSLVLSMWVVNLFQGQCESSKTLTISREFYKFNLNIKSSDGGLATASLQSWAVFLKDSRQFLLVFRTTQNESGWGASLGQSTEVQGATKAFQDRGPFWRNI